MKKLMFLGFFAILSVLTFAQKSETRDVKNFHGISASSSFKIALHKGNAEKVVVSVGDEDVLKYVKTVVENGVLKLYIKNDDKKWWKWFNKNSRDLKADITVVNLDYVHLSGACEIKSDDVFEAKKFELELSGATSARLRVKANDFDSDMSGASDLKLGLNAVTAEFEGSGSTSMNLNLRVSQKVDFDLSGASEIKIQGTAKKVSYELSGASEVSAFNFSSETVEVDASGASELKLSVDKSLVAKVSGASSLKYKGNPKLVEYHSSGAGSIKSIE
jgi:hypothetical protein